MPKILDTTEANLLVTHRAGAATDADTLALWRLVALRAASYGADVTTWIEPTPDQLATVRAGFATTASFSDLSAADPTVPVDHVGVALAWGQVVYEALPDDVCSDCGCHIGHPPVAQCCDCECHDEMAELIW